MIVSIALKTVVATLVMHFKIFHVHKQIYILQNSPQIERIEIICPSNAQKHGFVSAHCQQQHRYPQKSGHLKY